MSSTHTDHDDDDNIKALKRLRDLPRGATTQIDSRIAAIKNLLGEKEIFKTLQVLRWPKGIVCPRCKSSQVVRRDPPPDAPDRRHYYECLRCKGEGSPSDFDDFTGLPIGTLQGLRQSILCWYLIGFCSLSQIAKVLGLSVYEVSQMAGLGTQITEIADVTEKKALEAKTEKALSEREKAHKRAKAQVEEQELDTQSASKKPLKPGYKAKF